jgi:hypothetical protein
MNKLEARFDCVTRTIITDVVVRRTAKPGSFVRGAPIVDIPTRALWDTGAYMSVISASLAQHLGLAVINTDKLTGIGGTILSNRYDISVTLPNKVIFPLVYVAEWGGHRFYDMLIGMDIISQGNFSIANDTGKTVFTFKA